ncbi:MAG: hypothetical protein JRJ09_04325 [Deltaproteobacteria bacterium]|nr:hypothetical protein [Deltaproteobacteria bacterium]
MKAKGNIALIICLIVLLLLVSSAGVIIYYYTHPTAVKALMEGAVSRATGTTFTIESLAYSLDPMKVIAKGIAMHPAGDLDGFYFEVPGVRARLSIEGPFGERSLVFKSLRVEGFSCRVSKDLTRPGLEPGARSLSFLGGFIRRAFALFLFRDIRFQEAELSGGTVSAQLGEQSLSVDQVHARLNSDHLIELSCAVRARWPSRKISLTVPCFSLETDRAISLVDPQMGYSVTIGQALLETPALRVGHISGRGRLIYHHGLQELTVEHLSLGLGELVRKNGSQQEPTLSGVHLETGGLINLRDGRVEARSIHLSVNHILRFNGRLDGTFHDERRLRLEVADCNLVPEDLLPLVSPRMAERFAFISLSGPINIQGTVDGLEEQGQWRWGCDLQALLKQNGLSCRTKKARFSGRVAGRVSVKGQVPNLEVTAIMRTDHALLSGGGIELKPFNASVSVSGIYPVYQLRDFHARIPRAKGPLGKGTFTVDDIELKIARGRINVANQAISLPEIRFSSSLLKNLLIWVKSDRGKRSAGLTGKKVGLIRSAAILGFLPSGWEFRGLESVQMEIESEKGRGASLTAELALQDLSLKNQDGSAAGEKISLRVKMDGSLDPAGLIIAGHTDLSIDRGEVLYDRFYFDLMEHPMSGSCKWSYHLDGPRVQLSDLRVALKDILKLRINGTIMKRGPAWDFDLASRVPKTPLGPLFHHLILEPFQTEKPFLKEISVGGAIAADLELTGTGTGWITKGLLRWHDGALSFTDQSVSLKGIHLSLPLWYQNYPKESPMERLRGTLSIRSMNLPMLPEQRLALSFHGDPDLLSVDSPTVLKVPGGEIRVGPVTIGGLYGSRPWVNINTSLLVDSVEVGPIAARLWNHPVPGTIRGRLNPVVYEKGTLKSTGAIRVDAFGGELTLSDIGVSDLSGATPVFRLNARWKNINLAELTADTTFGKIEGILNGYARNVEVSQGQPQRFDLLLETEERAGVPQRISVKAVDNIAKIGGGQSPFVGIAGLFSSLFKEFPYRKIGVHAVLVNDIFRLSGTIREGGKEYFVKRGLFSGVDVVNQNPDNRVSFKDMLRRIKRVTASESGPIIR